jgi:site-specific DNA-cytosine methylase
MSHMAKDTYGYIHPYQARTLSVREAARIQTFPDWYSFGVMTLGEAFRAIGNAVPPLLSHQLAGRVSQILQVAEVAQSEQAYAAVG